jgi:hypothetical protein
VMSATLPSSFPMVPLSLIVEYSDGTFDYGQTLLQSCGLARPIHEKSGERADAIDLVA